MHLLTYYVNSVWQRRLSEGGYCMQGRSQEFADG